MGIVNGLEIFNKILRLRIEKLPVNIHMRALHTLLDRLLDEILSEEKIHFTNLFTKITYLSLKLKFNRELIHFLHQHRIDFTHENFDKQAIERTEYALYELLRKVDNLSKLVGGEKLFPKPAVNLATRSKEARYVQFARVHVFSFDLNSFTLNGYDENLPDVDITIQLNDPAKNIEFNSLLHFIQRTDKLPLTLHLTEIEVSEAGVYHPRTIVFEPDYLLDVTTVSECYKPGESSPLFYFLKKFIPVIQNKYLIIGNLANFFVDELFYDSSISFKELIKKTFRLSPLGFSLMNDMEIREVVATLKKHYHSIKEVITHHFPRHEITTENSMLEPSFYSPLYGIQGRLDLYSESGEQKVAKIVELKSGKPYKANAYGLNINHYVQTLLYDLMVNEVTDGRYKISNFILYSSQPQDPLRFAPPLKVQQRDAIRLRNQLVEIDYLLADLQIDNDHLFSHIQGSAIKSDGFGKRDIERFQKTYEGASSLVRKYFNAFTAFIAREQILAKTGEFGLDKSSGLAGLWLDDMQEKIENFRVLNALQVIKVNVAQSHTIITLLRTAETATNANFRLGDLGVLYPFTHGNRSVLKNQIYKCSIIDLNHNEITVRLRNKQNNTTKFLQGHQWHIEHDHLDHGFTGMYQDLFHFLGQKEGYQQRLLGLEAPATPLLTGNYKFAAYVTDQQARILTEMIDAEDYYLLWGPPGTGKTSVVLYEYLKYIFTNTDEKVLVLAYTNRAVDEICEAIHRISSDIQDYYFRIGSRYSSHSAFTDNLLVSKLEEIENRAEMLSLIQKSRFIVSTLASIQGKKELFSIIKVDTIVVDEASQILEPQIVGLLSYAPKFILIGDHYQLPAIVRQREDESEVQDQELRSIGLLERRNSLFERLYRKCEEAKWNWALGRLSQQGRMHEEIMHFVNQHFYNDRLSVIPTRSLLMLPQNVWQGSRMLFIPVERDESSINNKTNKQEAAKIVRVVKGLLTHEIPTKLEDIGVITPYRAQISAIKLAAHEGGIKGELHVDTVERYQGGARDYIIISLCLNTEGQLKQLVSLSSDGIDRKLNVALTRARKQIVVLGNEAIMKKNTTYSKLIDYAKKVDLE